MAQQANLVQDLERLKALREQGHLSEAEFAAAKAHLLNEVAAEEVGSPGDQVTTKETLSEQSTSPQEWYEEPPVRSRMPQLTSILALLLLTAGGAYFWYRSQTVAFSQMVLANSPVNCRAEPSVGSESLQIVYDNTPFQVNEERQGWLTADEMDCWIRADLVTVQSFGSSGEQADAAPLEVAPTKTSTASLLNAPPATINTPKGRATCPEAIGQSSAQACEVAVRDTLYYGSPAELRLSSQMFSRQAQEQCPGSGQLISGLYQAAAHSLITQLSPGWSAIDARSDPGQLMFTRCNGEVAAVLASVPGFDQEMARYR